MKALKLLALSSLVIASPLMAADAELSLTSDSVKGQVNFLSPRSDIDFASGYTYHDDKRHLINVDFHAKGQTALGNLPTTAGIGIQALAWDDDLFDGGAAGIGGFAHINFPEMPGLSFRGAAHFAPKILSFGDAESMLSLESSINYRVIRNADAFLGYRFIEADLDNKRSSNLKLDKGIMAGMRIFF